MKCWVSIPFIQVLLLSHDVKMGLLSKRLPIYKSNDQVFIGMVSSYALLLPVAAGHKS